MPKTGNSRCRDTKSRFSRRCANVPSTVTAVLVLSRPFGVAVGQGIVHELLSAALFLTAGLALGAACVALRCLPHFDATPSSSS